MMHFFANGDRLGDTLSFFFVVFLKKSIYGAFCRLCQVEIPQDIACATSDCIMPEPISSKNIVSHLYQVLRAAKLRKSQASTVKNYLQRALS